jgi:hypothetical protein
VVHFTTAFAPTWDGRVATTRAMEPQGWCKTRAGSLSCTGCADAAYLHWIQCARELNRSSAV